MRVYLETDRLVLRYLTADDADNLIELDSDPEVMRYLSGGEPTSPQRIREVVLPYMLEYYEQGDAFGYWAAIEKSTGEFLGWFHFREHPSEGGPAGAPERDGIEVGYRLLKKAWGKGYGTEGTRALVGKGFRELGVRRVYAETMAVNKASRRVMEKSGLSYVRTFKQDWPEQIEGSELGEVEYAVTREEWLKKS